MLRPGGSENLLTVTFGAALGIDCRGRFTFSGQIDWAPKQTTLDPAPPAGPGASKRTFFGFGIWKSVYLVPVPSAAILHLVTHTFYAGGHPTLIISDDSHAGFHVNVTLHAWAPRAVRGRVSVVGDWPGASNIALTAAFSPGESSVTLQIPAAQTRGARLWHPHGHGEQPLYTITAAFTPDAGNHTISTVRRLGFRHVALVTINDSNSTVATNAAQQDGTGQFGMFFRVNGAAVYARGANWIPSDLLDGRVTASAQRRQVQSVAEGNMNTLRVWGGGIWETSTFFDACDELGILLYTDMQFTWQNINGSTDERAEIIHQVPAHNNHIQR